MVKSEILKEKAARIVESNDEVKIEFLTVVTSHNGLIISGSISTSFKRFTEKYGQEKFEEIKNELIDEGIVSVSSSGSIQLTVRNERGDYDYGKGEEISKFIGKLIFEHNTKMRVIIDRIFKELEGKEFLKYIGEKNGIRTSDGREPEVKETIGKRSYEKILRDLVDAGVLTGYAHSSRKHDYHGYNILPSVEIYLKERLSPFELSTVENELKESGLSGATIYRCFDVLREIYIGQNIRDEGILQSDFLEYKNEIETLKKCGFIEDNSWYSSHLYVTTEKGSRVGKLIIENRIHDKKAETVNTIISLPPNSIGFLLFDYMASSLVYPVGEEYPYDWREPLLSDTRIWVLRNKILSKLEKVGLCIKTQLYVSTRGGELRGAHYVVCEEVLNFLKDCTAYKGGLYGREKKICLLYNFLKEAKLSLKIEDINEVRERYYNRMEGLQLTEEEIGEIVNEMAKSGTTSEYDGLLSDKPPFSIKDETRYDIHLKEQLVKPVIHFLLGKTAAEVGVKVEEVDEERIEEVRRIEKEKIKSLGIASKEDHLQLYDEISTFELELRQLIEEQLERKFGGSWLEKCVPATILKKWNKQKNDEEKDGIEPEREIINYANFSDYKKIIISNWEGIFEPCFKKKEDLKVRLDDLNKLGRRSVMHIRSLNEEKVYVTRYSINWLRSKINSFRE